MFTKTHNDYPAIANGAEVELMFSLFSDLRDLGQCVLLKINRLI